jgi:hypothetical protein
MPAQAGIQKYLTVLGSRLRGNDETTVVQSFLRGWASNGVHRRLSKCREW